jgi:hypothetical protein
MDMPSKHDWLNVGAIVPLLGVLFSSAFGLFAGPVMTSQVEILWIMGIVIIAFLVWFNAAKVQQQQLLARPETTLEDVRRAATGTDDSLANTPLVLRVQAEADRERQK